ncbi:dihydroorotase [Polluticaenibacter yanchengensis]|uniref:Dihydroorotase n=1 Tax=Polluticaenibacter yanchengensis TaxID=3014562 RepID=A0ABT4UL59_9BACT|nr:dihydroorotase [Chitinophagaceae bacterium LY-5]
MKNYLIKNASVVTDGKCNVLDVLIKEGRIEKIDYTISVDFDVEEIDGTGLHLLPGVIDDQVHFREPGLTHKGDIYTESRAAVAGGVTSFMEMPNTVPNALTQELLENKYAIAAEKSIANYSFFMGTGNDNAEEVLKTNKLKNSICGIKIFMGSSTGNMLVDNENTLNKIFKESEVLIATHCESEAVIKSNLQKLEGVELTPAHHPVIRNEAACFESSKLAVDLAVKHNTRLHILHITTAEELALFSNQQPLKEKRITSEVCVHHLYFTASDYAAKGYDIKCNPAIKDARHKPQLWEALLNDTLDIIATDHAPHTREEKVGPYAHAHSGLPLVQHSLPLMLQYVNKGNITIEKLVEKMSHAPAVCFSIGERGFIREGYLADLVLVDLNKNTTVDQSNILYKCGWSPLEGEALPTVTHTFVNGNLVFHNGEIIEGTSGSRLAFDRN